jgi:hypothetical protein
MQDDVELTERSIAPRLDCSVTPDDDEEDEEEATCKLVRQLAAAKTE